MGALIAGALLAALLALPAPALAQTIVDAFYNRNQDELVVDIAYQGTHPNHEFTIVWEGCEQRGPGRQVAVGRLIDNQGNDLAKSDFQVRQRFPLSGLACRPAELTIRLGPVSNRTVAVPAAGR